MKLICSVTPHVYDEYNGVTIDITFESNLNLNKYTVSQHIPKSYDLDLRNRILDNMFYELRKQVDFESKALKEFLSLQKSILDKTENK